MLELVGVGVTYPSGVAALKKTDLQIHRHQVTALIGPSGAGKSTLLRTLNLLVNPTTGRVKFGGATKHNDPASIRRHRRSCAMIFQQHQLIGRRTALQNVLTGRLGHHSSLRTLMPLGTRDRRMALSCLERVGLLDKALSRCDQLSGGQQQRVGIARALVQEPTVILADEPVASLDPAAANQVLRQLLTISRQDGTPIVISLHQLDYARQFADRIIGLSNGMIVFDDAPEHLDETLVKQIYQTN